MVLTPRDRPTIILLCHPTIQSTTNDCHHRPKDSHLCFVPLVSYIFTYLAFYSACIYLANVLSVLEFNLHSYHCDFFSSKQIMASQHDEILAACAAGDLERVREIYPAISSAENNVPLDAMILKAAEKNQYETVRYCLEKGAKVSPLVVDEASEFPEVFKVLVTDGGLDVNEDFETAGDMLINAVWEQKVGCNILKQTLSSNPRFFASLILQSGSLSTEPTQILAT